MQTKRTFLISLTAIILKVASPTLSSALWSGTWFSRSAIGTMMVEGAESASSSLSSEKELIARVVSPAEKRISQQNKIKQRNNWKTSNRLTVHSLTQVN